MDPIFAGGLIAAAVWSVVFGAKFFTPARFDHPVIVNGVWIGGVK